MPILSSMSQAIMTCSATSDEKAGITTTLFSLSESELVYKQRKINIYCMKIKIYLQKNFGDFEDTIHLFLVNKREMQMGGWQYFIQLW